MTRKIRKPDVATPAALPVAVPATENWIERRASAIRSDLASARELHKELLASYAEGREVADQLRTVELEIRAHNDELDRLDNARKALSARNTSDARVKAREHTVEQLKAALADARKLGEAVLETFVVVAELNARLAMVHETRDAIRSRVADAISDNRPGHPAHILDQQYRQLDMALRELTLPESFQRRLWSAGVGRVGIQLDDSAFSIRPVSSRFTEQDPEEAIHAAVSKLHALAKASLANKLPAVA